MPLRDIVGHRLLVDLLQRAVARDRVPQSLLFAGPEGVGKRTTALALAQALNCPQRSAGDACGRCATCLRIARGQYSDVVVLNRGDEASIKIRALREGVLDVVGYRPFEGARRVYVIDDADALTSEAQDALLKTFEEPPPAAVLILVTAYADTLLPTIQSRGRRLRFAPLSDADVARVLTGPCRLDHARARLLAATAGGSVSVALAEEAGDLADDRDAALAIVTVAAQNLGVAGRLKAAAAFAQHGSKRRDREALGTRLAILSSMLRDLAGLRAGVDPASTLANADLTAALHDLAPAFDVERVSRAFDAVGLAHGYLDRYASPKIVSDWIACQL